MMATLFCVYYPGINSWRVRDYYNITLTRVSVREYKGEKQMRIPALQPMKPGQFCNPKKVVLKFQQESSMKRPTEGLP